MVGCSHIFLAKVSILGSRAPRPPLPPNDLLAQQYQLMLRRRATSGLHMK